MTTTVVILWLLSGAVSPVAYAIKATELTLADVFIGLIFIVAGPMFPIFYWVYRLLRYSDRVVIWSRKDRS